MFTLLLSFLWVMCAMAELSSQEFIEQFVEAMMEGKNEKAIQLVRQNPKIAMQARRALQQNGQGGKDAETTKVIDNMLYQILSILKLEHLYMEGEEAYYNSKYQESILKWKEGLELATELRNESAISDFLGSLGVVYKTLSQYKEALKYHEQALANHRKINDRKGEGGDLTNIGIVYDLLGHHKKALEHFNLALLIDQEIDDIVKKGKDIGNIALVYLQLCRYEKALEYFKVALRIHRTARNRRAEASSLNNIGNTYNKLGQYENGLKYYRDALAINRELYDQRSEAGSLHNIGAAYHSLGLYEEALEHFNQSMAIHKMIRDRRGEGGNLTYIGLTYSRLGQYEKALENYKQALKIDREIDNLSGEGGNLNNIGLTYDSLAQHEKAIEYYKQALMIHRKINQREGEIACLSNIGLWFWSFSKYKKALEYLKQSLTIGKEIGNQKSEGSTLFNIGVVYTSLEQYDKAYQAYSESFDICFKIGAPEPLWRVQRGLGELKSKLGKYDKAIIHYEQSLDIIQSMRSDLSEKGSKISFMRSKLHVYDELIELLQKLHKDHPSKGYDQKSLEIFEKKQGRIFLEEMGKSGARRFAGLPDDMRNQEDKIENGIINARSSLSEEYSKPEKQQNKDRIKNLNARLTILREQQEKLKQKLKVSHPDYYAIKYPEPATLAELQKQLLKSDETILVYGVMEKKTCLWVISKKQFGFYPIEIGEEALGETVNEFRKGPDSVREAIEKSVSEVRSTVRKNMRETRKSGRNLYNLLIPEEARKALSKDQPLYIVPTGPLYALPFEALVTSDNHYLIEDYPIAYLSSASLLKTLREADARRKEQAKHPLLAFAHPVYDYEETTPDPVSSRTETSFSLADMRTRAYLNIMGENFKELPETEGEVREIKTVLEAPEDSLQLRKAASRSSVFQFHESKRLDDYRFIIFSCHGILPGEISYVTQPSLVLSLPDPVTQEEEYLTMADVFGLKLNADLVSLSACNSGRGKTIKGEGVIGLTRTFMYAGTPAVSVTLWSVASGSSKILNIGLYKNLKAGKHRAEALREIKLRMIQGHKGGLFRHPFFWAPMVIFGDGR